MARRRRTPPAPPPAVSPVVGDPLTEAVSRGLHLTSPAAMAEILTRGKFERPPHINLVNRHLVQMARGDLDRLAVAMPPHHGKSSLISLWQIVWRLAIDPSVEIGIASYNFEMARVFAYEARRLCREFMPDLGLEILEDSKAAHHWRTSAGGRVLASGLDGTFTGHHFHLIVIDDPVKNAIEAESPTAKEAAWDWYRSVVLGRVRPGGGICIVQTRWSPDDLMGRILKAESEAYRLVSLPGLAEDNDPLGRKQGDALWPKIMTAAQLIQRRKTQGEYVFAAQYQQRPSPKGGGLIKHASFNYWVPAGRRNDFSPVTVDGRECEVIELPEHFDGVGPIQSWDCNFRDSVRAIERGKEPDPVAGHVVARRGGDYFLLDRYHAPVGLSETIEAVRRMSAAWPSAVVKLVEYMANGVAVISKLRHEIGGFIPVTPRGTKVARMARPVEAPTAQDREARVVTMLGTIEAGNFYLPHPALKPWVRELLHLLGQFPRAGRDDADALSQAWAYLAKGEWSEARAAALEAAKKKPEPETPMQALKQRVRENLERQLRGPSPADVYWR